MLRGRSTIVLALALAVSVPAGGDELWRGPLAAADCRVVLINEVGGARLGTDLSAVEAVVLGAASEVTVEAAASPEQTVLTVARRGGGPAGGDVELRMPPGCAVTLRTGRGSVEIEIGREASPVAVETVTGDVTARIDPAAGATVHLATSGEITTDYTIAIDFRYHEEPAKIGRVVIGSGATGVRLTSRRGAVRVLRPTGKPAGQ